MKGKLNIKRKLLAVCLSMICVLTTCVPAFAEDYVIDADPEITYDGDSIAADSFAFEGDTDNYYENEAIEDSWASDEDMWAFSDTAEFQDYADPMPEVEEDQADYDASFTDIWNWDDTSELETDAVDFGYDFIPEKQTEEESDIVEHVMDATIDLYESASYMDDYKCVSISARADSENDTEIRVFFWNMDADDSIEPCYDVNIANCEDSTLYLPVVYSDESTDSAVATLVNDDYNVYLEMLLPAGSSMNADIYVKNSDSGYGENQMFLEAVCMCDGQKISADDLTLEFDSEIANYSIVLTDEDSEEYDSEEDELFDIQTYAEEPSTDAQDEDDDFATFADGEVTPITTITVYKDWDDADNQDGIRPDSITIALYESGEVVDTLILDDSNRWSGKFTDLDGDKSYRIQEEDVPDGYQSFRQSAIDSMSGIESWGFTNTHTPETIDISGSATWNDDNDQENIRPSSITIQLLADNVLVDEKVVTASDNWEWTFDDVPKYSEGSLITYTVLQKSVSGYTSSADGYNITNNYNPEKTQVSVRVVWDDSKNANKIRPDTLTVALLKNDAETGDTAELNESNNWSCTFDDLDEYTDGVLNTYSVAAVDLDGYDCVLSGDIESGFVLTNSILPDTTSITATLIWDDGNDQDGKRPAEVTLQLYADDDEYGDPVTVTGDGVSWTYTWNDLPEFNDGAEITYTVKATSNIEDYDVSYSTDGLTVTYTYASSTISVSGEKTWNDADDQEGVRPSSIVIRLYADGSEVSEKTVTADDGWKWVFDDLPEYSNGSKITYTIKEDDVDGYMTVIDGFNVTNTYEPETTDNEDNKNEDDTGDTEATEAPETETKPEIEPESETNADDDDISTPMFYSVSAQVVSSDGNGSALDDYNRVELEMSTYLPTMSADDLVNGNYTIRFHNKLSSGLNLDETDSDLSVYVGGQEISSAYYEIKDKVNSEDETSFHVDVDLTQMYIDGVIDDDDLDGNTEISVYYYAVPDTTAAESSYESTVWYEIRDNDVIHYTSDEDVVTIVIEVESKISVSVLKVWDENGYDEYRPDDITVDLLANGDIVDSLILNDDNYWLGEFSGLDAYEDGEQITYTVEEEPVADYESSVTGDIDTGFVITNTLTVEIKPELIDIDGKKIWDDDDNLEGIRPSEITIVLYADGVEIDEITVTEEDDWYWTFEDLPKYEDEASYDYREVEYTIDEKPVSGYESTIIGDADSGFTVINMLADVSDRIDIEGWKIWEDDDDIADIRPTEIKISLFADGVEIEETTVTEGDDWHWVFEDLPKYQEYQDGEDQYYDEIVYTIDEMSVDGYYTTITGNSDYGFTVINSLIDYDYESELINISGRKVWNDNDNQNGIRPTEIKISLYANGEEVIQTAVTAEDNWAWVFEDMPKYYEYVDDAGELKYAEIEYTLKEMAVDGYESIVTGNAESGFVVTNTHAVEAESYDRISISGKKTWYDDDNIYRMRPSEIIIRLYADGEEVEWMTVKEENNWAWTFTDLPRYKDGVEIKYSISEDAVNGYTVTYDGYNVINTLTEESKAAYIAEYGDPNGTTGSAAYEYADGSTADGVNLDELLKGDGYLVQTGDDFNAVPLVAAIAVIVILCGCGIYFSRKRGKTAE